MILYSIDIWMVEKYEIAGYTGRILPPERDRLFDLLKFRRAASEQSGLVTKNTLAPDPKLDQTINQINELISKYNQLVAQRKGKRG